MAKLNKKQFQFTRHSIQRFSQRLRYIVKDNDVVKSMACELYRSKPNNAVKNNTKFMTYVQEKHGYDAFDFLISDHAVFVCKQDKLITVYPKSGSMFELVSSRFTK